MITHRVTRHGGLGAIFFAIGLILLGGYYLLRNTFGFDLPELEAEAVVPIIAIALGVVILVRVWDERQQPPAA